MRENFLHSSKKEKSNSSNGKMTPNEQYATKFENHQIENLIHEDEEKMSLTNLSEKKEEKSHLNYRADIDGLRTIAIVVVVIFHAFPTFMSGGFVGVDVFFVISGYLISGIIFKQVEKNQFSVIDFYERRIKRIYPALILVLLCSLIIAHKAYHYKQLKQTASTLAASTIFSANIQLLFHKQSYFGSSEKQNAFIHLWSLGVEEQFYIIWPCLVMLVLAKFRSFTSLLIGIFTFGSFAVGLYAVYNSPKIAFYYPLCRLWEMSIGGLIAYQKFQFKSHSFNHILSISGTLAILIVIWIVNQESHFPGWWALIPTLSSACILVAGPEAFVNRHLLSTKLFVFIGKISYPLYLWHWPLMVFSRKLFPEGSTSILGNMFFIIFLSVSLSVFTYYCIENKIRFRKEQLIVFFLLVSMLFVGVYVKRIVIDQDDRPILAVSDMSPDSGTNQSDSEYIRQMKEYQKSMIPTEEDYVIKNGKKHPNSSKNPNRQSTSIQKLQTPQKYFDYFIDVPPQKLLLQKAIDKSSKYYSSYVPEDINNFQVSNQGQQNELFIVGDSHAKFITVRFQHLYEQAKKRNQTQSFPTIVSLCKSGFAQVSQTANYSKQIEMYRTYTSFTHNYLKLHKPKRMLSINRWLGYWKACDVGCVPDKPTFSPEHIQLIKSQIDEYAAFMKELVDVGIEVTVPTLHFDDDRLDPLKMHDLFEVIEERVKPISYEEFRKKYSDLIDYFEKSLTKAGVKIININENMCWEDRCQVLTPTGYPVFNDMQHYGYIYSKYWVSSVDHLVDF